MPVLSTLTGGTRRCHEQALGSVEMCGASLFAKNNASNSICSTCVKRRLSRPRLSGKKYDHLLHDVISIGGGSRVSSCSCHCLSGDRSPSPRVTGSSSLIATSGWSNFRQHVIECRAQVIRQSGYRRDRAQHIQSFTSTVKYIIGAFLISTRNQTHLQSGVFLHKSGLHQDSHTRLGTYNRESIQGSESLGKGSSPSTGRARANRRWLILFNINMFTHSGILT